jgi:hypothetical protein
MELANWLVSFIPLGSGYTQIVEENRRLQHTEMPWLIHNYNGTSSSFTFYGLGPIQN